MPASVLTGNQDIFTLSALELICNVFLFGIQKASGARHHPALLAALAAELRCSPDAIVDLELNVCDTQPGAIGGALGSSTLTSAREFLRSGRGF